MKPFIAFRAGSADSPALQFRPGLYPHCPNPWLDELNPVKPPQPEASQGIYILPNLFTTAALFAGFYAIVQAMNGRFRQAAVAIFIAMVPGRPRWPCGALTLTRVFGAEYDSLPTWFPLARRRPDHVYEWALRAWALGWMAAFIYCRRRGPAAGASTPTSTWWISAFRACPSRRRPLVAGLVWVMIETAYRRPDIRWYACALTIFAGISMVSNVLFYSGKEINLRKSVPSSCIAFVIGLCWFPAIRRGCCSACYAPVLWPPPGYVLRLERLRKGASAALGDRQG